MVKLRTLLLYDYLYISLVFIAVLYSYCVLNYYPYQSKYNEDDVIIEGYIHNLTIDGNKLSIELFGKEKIIVNYYFKNLEEKNNFILNLGDYIRVNGVINKPRSATFFNLFDYKKFLFYKKIFFTFTADKIELVKENTRLRYKIKQYITDYIDNIPLSFSYIKALVIGDNSEFNNEVYRSLQFNGVNHLFAISGTHISFLSIAILWFLKRIRIEENKRYYFVIVFLVFYMFLTDYSGSVMRASIFFILLAINKMYYFHIKTINILYLTLFLILFLNPGLLYNVGFQFSFVISFYLVFFQNLISKYNNYMNQTLIVSIISFLVSIPICSIYFFQINFLSPLFNIFFVPYVTIILFPLCFVCLVFPFLDVVLYAFINILEFITLFLNNIKIGEVILAKPTLLVIVAYYLFITICIKGFLNKKYYLLIPLFLMIVIHHNVNYFNRDCHLVFLDVGQGDSIFIKLPNGKGNILIDTGGQSIYEEDWQKKNKRYSIAQDGIIPYLKSIGISKLDYLILTHGDEDHMGESKNIVDEFKVLNVVLNDGSLTKLEENLIETLDYKNIPYYFGKRGDTIHIDDFQFHIINPNIDTNENDNSIVLYANIFNTNILLTGDISVNIERNIMSEYHNLNVDILKIGHHGSITSTCSEFLDHLEPKYGIIQVGVNNRFNHPNKAVLDRLVERNVKIFQTSVNGSIKFIIRSNDVTVISALT